MLIALQEDSIRCFQRAIDLILKSKIFRPSTIADAMQHWLHQTSASTILQHDVLLEETHLGAWVILEALFFSCSIEDDEDDGISVDSELIAQHWKVQSTTFTLSGIPSSTGSRMLTVLQT